jgi:hypothetical protein
MREKKMKNLRATAKLSVRLVVSTALVCNLFVSAASQEPPVDLRGIYVVGGVEDPFPNKAATALAASLDVPGVDGLVLVVGWDDIEPTKGHFAWEHTPDNPLGTNPLDTWIDMATSLGKKVELSVVAFRTPLWLFQEAEGFTPARQLIFTYPHRDSSCGDPKTETIAAPWDQTFLNEWGTMLAAVAHHLNCTERYNAISILRLTGINLDSDELHLPSNQSAPAPCTDSVNTWLTVAKPAYRPFRLLHAWDVITSYFKKSFPDKYFSVAIIDSTHPFPPIDDNGNIIADTQGLSPIQNRPLLQLVRLKFPGRLVIQNNSLYPPDPAQPETIHFAQSLGTMIAFQTNEDIDYLNNPVPNVFGKGAGCGARTDPNPTPCTDAPTFLQMLETGIYPLCKAHVHCEDNPLLQPNPLRARYIEVFAPNVNDFVNDSPQPTLQAHLELITPPFVSLSFPDPPNGTGGWNKGPVTGTVRASSAVGHTITNITCQRANAVSPVGLNSLNASATVDTSTQGDPVKVLCVATDSVGYQGEAVYPLLIDTAPPVTTVNTHLRYVHGVQGPVSLEVDFTATDKLSGVAKTEYSLDHGSTWIVGTKLVLFDGTFTIRFRSTDVVGNVETPKSITLNVHL